MIVEIKMVLACVAGYLLGAIPVGYLIVRARGLDVRAVGSGRTGGTNVMRAAGTWAAAGTIVGDALKGAVAVWLARYLGAGEWGAALAGIGAVAGHIWPIFLGWKGGAGGITAAAVLLALSPMVGGAVSLAGLAVGLIWRYASLTSLTIAWLAPFGLYIASLLGRPTAHVAYGVVAALLITYTLRPNIARLCAGTERRIGRLFEPTRTTNGSAKPPDRCFNNGDFGGR